MKNELKQMYANDFKSFIDCLSTKDYDIMLNDEAGQVICNLKNDNKELNVSVSTLGKVIYASIFYKEICICAVKCHSIIISEKEKK